MKKPDPNPAKAGHLKQIADDISALKQLAEHSDAAESLREFRAGYKAFHDVTGVYDETLGKVEQISEFIDMVEEVTIEGIVSISAIAALPSQANCMRNYKGGMPQGCELRPGELAMLRRFQEYVGATDAVQCFQAAGNVSAAMK